MTRNARLGLEEMPASGYISKQQLRFCLSKKELGMDEALVLRELASIDEVPDLLDIWRSSVERRRDSSQLQTLMQWQPPWKQSIASR